MSYKDEVLASTPVAYWPFETANAIEYDLVSNVPANKVGALDVRPTLYPSAFGVDFKNLAEYYHVLPADMGGIYWNGSSYTAECLCLADSLAQDTLFSQRTNSSSSDQGFSLFAGTAGAGVVVVDMGSSSTRKTMSGYTWPTNKYIHCVFTYDGTTKEGRLFADGEQVGYTSWVTNPAPSSVPPLFIGLLGGNSSYNWDGIISHVAFYRRQLSAAEVKRHYLASGAKGVNVLIDGKAIRKPVRNSTGKFIPVNKK